MRNTPIRRGSAPGFLLAAILVALGAGCGGTPFPSSAGTPTTNPPAVATGRTANVRHRASGAPAPVGTVPSTTTTTTPAASRTTTTRPAAPKPPAPSPRTLIPRVDVLGSQWVDEGDPGTSLDLTDPPPQCAAFRSVFDTRRATALHEYSYLPTADGQFERGHMNIAAIRAAAPTVVATTLAAVAQPSFAQCAEASAVRRLEEVTDQTFDSATAKLVSFTVGVPIVVWRATITSHNPSTGAAETMEMDVAYLGAGDRLVKMRVATCGCLAPVVSGELLPGELHMLQTLGLLLAHN